MFKDITFWGLFLWAFIGYMEYSIANVNEPTILSCVYAKVGVDLRPGAEATGFIIAFLVWFFIGWRPCWAIVAAMSLQMIISAKLFKHFYRKGFN